MPLKVLSIYTTIARKAYIESAVSGLINVDLLFELKRKVAAGVGPHKASEYQRRINQLEEDVCRALRRLKHGGMIDDEEGLVWIIMRGGRKLPRNRRDYKPHNPNANSYLS